MVGRQQSASQEENPRQVLSRLTLNLRLPTIQIAKKEIIIVYITQSTVFCYGSSNRLIQSYKLYMTLIIIHKIHEGTED